MVRNKRNKGVLFPSGTDPAIKIFLKLNNKLMTTETSNTHENF